MPKAYRVFVAMPALPRLKSAPVVRARGRGVIGANPARHIDLARGADIEYAGEMQFGSSHRGRGQIRWWDNASGHYRPEGVYAHQAGLPVHLFRNYSGD